MNTDILIVKKQKDLPKGAEAFFAGKKTVKVKKSFKHQFGIALSNYAITKRIELWECDMASRFGYIEYKLKPSK
jgi:hypothetical protein